MGEATALTLIVTAFTLGLFHTVIGPDHYIPFIALARSGKWSLRKTLSITGLCGIGHVLSSVLIGLIGVAAGIALSSLEEVEETRGSIATFALIGFGLAYGVVGLWHGLRGRSHSHTHVHEDGTMHSHEHSHERAHIHPHGRAVWVLFIVFVLGPCEPLIPLLIYPAATHDWLTLVTVTAVFGVATIGTMMAMVTMGWYGVRALRLGALERFSHALAGAVLALSGIMVLVLDV